VDTSNGHNGAEPHSKEPPGSAAGRLERDTKELLAAMERLSDDAGSSLREQVERRPYAALGLGLLGGYVLGGGLTSRFGGLVLSAVWRTALASLVTRGMAAHRTGDHGAIRTA
jgi:hypothetical protein